MNDDFLSNTYVVADEPGGHAVMIDAGGPVGPLLDFIARGQLTLTHVLLTHHHHDHISELDTVLERHPGVPVLIHELEREQVPQATATMAPGVVIESGALQITPLHTPGHTAGMLSLLVDGTDVFTGDTLFKGSVGGVRAPGQHELCRPQGLDHGHAADAARPDPHPPGPHGPDDGRRRAGVQSVRAHLARPGRRRRRALHRPGPARHPDPARGRLRWRSQGLGALARRLRRHRAGLARGAHSASA